MLGSWESQNSNSGSNKTKIFLQGAIYSLPIGWATAQ